MILAGMKFATGRCVTLLAISVLVVGCYSQQHYDAHNEMRRQRLLEMYPVRKTKQQDIAKRWGHAPQERQSRPKTGWENHSDAWVAKFTANAEKRIGKKITKVERYFGADGMFSLCYCWFYYDASDRLLDAEWQWSSD
jgi:hypothetical protein